MRLFVTYYISLSKIDAKYNLVRDESFVLGSIDIIDYNYHNKYYVNY